MAYTIGCQGCRKRYRVHSQALGRTVSCPVCRMPIAVPDPRLFGSRWSRGALTLPVAEPVDDGSFAGDAPMATQVKPGGSLRPPPLPMRPRADVAELPPDSGLLELLDDNGLLGTLLLAPRLGRMGRWLDWLEWSLRRELDFFPEGQGVVRFVASNKLACTAGALGLGLGLFELVSQGSWWGPVLAGLGLALAGHTELQFGEIVYHPQPSPMCPAVPPLASRLLILAFSVARSVLSGRISAAGQE